MNYMVMECHPGYVILLDEDGRFRKAANLHYEVGQTVQNPVFMNEETKNRRRMAGWVSGIAAMAACILLAFGFGYYQNYMAPYSSILLSINPMVEMELNKQGKVIGLSGSNEDGKQLLEGYDGIHKDKITVADELIDRAIAMGFLSEGGQVSFSIDTPDQAMFQEYGLELRTKVTEYLDGRMTVTIEILDHHSIREETGSTGGAAPDPSFQGDPPSSVPLVSSKLSRPSASSASGYSSGQTSFIPDRNGDTEERDTDYGPNNDGVTDYGDTDYGSDSQGEYPSVPSEAVPDSSDTDYGPDHDGDTLYEEPDDDTESDDDLDDSEEELDGEEDDSDEIKDF